MKSKSRDSMQGSPVLQKSTWRSLRIERLCFDFEKEYDSVILKKGMIV